MKLDDSIVRKFSTAKLFKDFKERINSLSFTADGSTLVCSSDDDSIATYDCQQGVHRRHVNSKKYGVDLIQCTHLPNMAIHGSTKIDDTIRYLSLPDNKYLRYFVGHTKKVTQLCMSPVDDTFISASLDKTVRIWDLKSQNCQGYLNIGFHSLAAIDPEGMVFAVGINAEHIKMYDLRSYDKGPFVTFKLNTEKDIEWTDLKYSPCGRFLMITTNKSYIHLLDSFSGKILHTLTGHMVSTKNAHAEATFSPDSAYVLASSADGKIFVWSSENGRLICALSGEHSSIAQRMAFNPKYMMLATACSSLCMWLPNNVEED